MSGRRSLKYGDKQVEIFDNSQSLAAALGPFITSIATNAIKARGKFTIAFSGGSLPATVGQALTVPSELEAIKPTLSKWHVFYADERCVKLDDKESNHAGVKQSFFDVLPQDSPIGHDYPINESLINDPAKAAEDYQKTIESVVDDGEFDLILLGMGPDGHTCSLFPGHALLKEKTKLIASITDSPKPPPQRITFTYPLVNKARHAVFVVTGDKADAIHSVLDHPTEGEPLPSARVHATNTAFFLDHKAAAKLNKL